MKAFELGFKPNSKEKHLEHQERMGFPELTNIFLVQCNLE